MLELLSSTTSALWQPYLQSRVNGEGAGGGVHAGHILGVVDLLQSEFRPVVPVAMVDVLSDQSVRLHGVVLVHLQC